MQYLIGIIIIVIGFLMVWKTNWFLSLFGRVEFAERFLGNEGGSRLFIKLVGIILIILVFTYWTGGLGKFLAGIFVRGR